MRDRFEGAGLASLRVLAAAVPALRATVVDSTGCGDAYCAGFITGLLRGWDLVDCARLGTAAARRPEVIAWAYWWSIAAGARERAPADPQLYLSP